VIVDANLLLYAADRDSSFHQRAADWLTQVMRGDSRLGLPWQVVVAYVRLATHPRVFARPLDPATAWQDVENWLRRDNVWVPQPTDRHREVLGGLVARHHPTGNLVSDAHLAALAIEHGVAICSADSDFARFPECRWVNPLQSG